MVFEGVIAALAASGIAGVYLPFLLLFAILFALLVKTKIFGEAQRINALLALIISLYIVAFSPVSGSIGLWFAQMFAALGVTLVSIIVFFLVVGLLVAPWWTEKVVGSKNWWKVLIPLGIVIGFLIVAGNVFSGVGPGGAITIPGLSSADILFIALVIITLIIIWYLVGSGAKAKTSRWSLLPER
jgi:hypothetical protein